MIKIILGYVVVSIIIAFIFLISSVLYSIAVRRISEKWIEQTYILSCISLLVVLILKLFYNDIFKMLGFGKEFSSYFIICGIGIASLPSAILAYLSNPNVKDVTLKKDVSMGMLMEIPMRGLVQNLFTIFGGGLVIFHFINLSIILNAIIWVQFIIIQEIMIKKQITLKVAIDCMASMWFSIFVGIIYSWTGNIIIAMITHGLERSIAYFIRYRKNEELDS